VDPIVYDPDGNKVAIHKSKLGKSKPRTGMGGSNAMARSAGILVTAALGLALLVAPLGLGAQPQDPCASSPVAEQKIAACTTVLRSRSSSASDLAVAYRNRGHAYSVQGEYDHAIPDFSAAVSIIPHYVDALIGRGNAYRAMGQNNLAVTDYLTVLRYAPSSSYAYDGLGSVYRSRGQVDLALRSFSTALQFNGRDATARCGRGDVYLAKGQNDLARFDYNAALRIDPQSACALLGRKRV